MRYMARRILSGEWIDRDLPLVEGENTRVLNGPSLIGGKVPPEFNRHLWNDGMRLAEDWATMIYAVDEDTGDILNSGIVLPPTSYEETSAAIQCAGVMSYAQGYIYTASRLWGPALGEPDLYGFFGNIYKYGTPDLPRPDPIEIFADHWEWIQQQQDSNLDVTITGDTSTRGPNGEPRSPIGNYEEPYRLAWYGAPDLGQEMSNLAEITPFDYIEEADWANEVHTDVSHEIRVGYPRHGRRRDDLRFAVGENVVITPAVQSLAGQANHIIGIGNGEAGPSMVASSVGRVDGRLRRTRVYTNKTITDIEIMRRRLAMQWSALDQRFDVTAVAISDHPNARISSIQLGDDIWLEFDHPEYGEIGLWVRVLSITTGDDSGAAVLTTSASNLFNYNPIEEF